MQMVLNSTGRWPGKGGVVEFAVTSTVEEAVPLKAAKDAGSLVRVALEPHEDPFLTSDPGERHVDSARAICGTAPGERAGIYAELSDSGPLINAIRLCPNANRCSIARLTPAA